MAQARPSDCPASRDAASGCASGHATVTIVDTSWGIPGLGPEGTIALGSMAVAAATMTIVAWRLLFPARTRRRVSPR